MNKEILLEIQKLKYLSVYDTGRTLMENTTVLLTEQWMSWLKHVPGGRIGGLTLKQLVEASSEVIFATFRKQYGDQFIDEIAAKLGKTTKAVENLLYKTVKAGDTLTLKESNIMVEQLCKNSEAYRGIVEPILKQEPNMVILKNMYDEGIVKMLDDKVKYGLDGFSDDFLGTLIDVDIRALRKALIKQAEENAADLLNQQKKKKAEEKKKKKKEEKKKIEQDKLAKEQAVKDAIARKAKNKALLQKVKTIFTRTVDFVSLIGGLMLMAATIGPLTSMIAMLGGRWALRMGSKVIKSLFGLKPGKGLTGTVQKELTAIRQAVTKESGIDKLPKLERGWMDRRMFEPTIKQFKRGPRQITYFSYITSAKFWRGAATFYILGKLAKNYFEWPDWIAEVLDPNAIAFFDSMIADPSGKGVAALQGKFSGPDQNIMSIEAVNNLGYEFNTSLIEQTADAFNDNFFWNDVTIETPYTVWPVMIDTANEFLVEFAEAAPNLLFVSMVSDKYKEKYGKTLWELITNYSSNLDTFLLQGAGEVIGFVGTWAVNIFTKEDLDEYKIAVERAPDIVELVKSLGSLRIIDAETDTLVVELYDYVVKGVEPGETGALGTLISDYELTCEDKKQIMDDSIGDVFDSIKTKGLERLTNLGIGVNQDNAQVNAEFDCMSGKYEVQIIEDIATLKQLDKLFTTVPVEGETYFAIIQDIEVDNFDWEVNANVGEEKLLLTTHANKDAIPYQTNIAINPQATIEQLVGKSMSLEPEKFLMSGDRSIAYFIATMNPHLVTRYNLKAPTMAEIERHLESSKIQYTGGVLTDKLLKANPILKTYAAVNMYKEHSRENLTPSFYPNITVSEVMRQSGTKDDIEDLGVDIPGLKENKVIGLARVLLS